MSTLEEARALARKLHALGGGADMRRKAAARELARREPLDANELIGHLHVPGPRRAGPPAILRAVRLRGRAGIRRPSTFPTRTRCGAWRRCSPWTRWRTSSPRGPPARRWTRARRPGRMRRAFTQSLGHLKQQARGSRGTRTCSRAWPPSATRPCIRNALLNPRLTEPLVVRIAARRPARPEPLVEIWRSPRAGRRATRCAARSSSTRTCRRRWARRSSRCSTPRTCRAGGGRGPVPPCASRPRACCCEPARRAAWSRWAPDCEEF